MKGNKGPKELSRKCISVAGQSTAGSTGTDKAGTLTTGDLTRELEEVGIASRIPIILEGAYDFFAE